MSNRKIGYFKKKINTPLAHLIMENDVNKLQDVITSSNVNDIIFEPLGLTSIHVAIMTNSNDVIKYLLEIGADIHKTNVNCMDCNELAVRYNQEYIKILEDYISRK